MARRICADLHLDPSWQRDRGLARVAAVQEGLVHRAQLVELDLGRRALAHRVAHGRLHPVAPDVFAVGRAELSPRGELIAALLSGGPDCVLSHGAAAEVWGLARPFRPGPAITVAGRHLRTRPGRIVYRVERLAVRDIRIRDGLPVTSPARTLLDEASALSDDELSADLAAARVARLVSDGELEDVLARHPLRPGAARLRRVLATGSGATATRSEAERRFLRLVAEAELPAPEVNVYVAGLEVDFLWRPERLIVEVDGYRFHSDRATFERDRSRGQRLTAAGFRVVRVSWRQLVGAPVAVAVRIAQSLAATAAA